MVPGLDPGIHRKCERPGESPAVLFLVQIPANSQRRLSTPIPAFDPCETHCRNSPLGCIVSEPNDHRWCVDCGDTMMIVPDRNMGSHHQLAEMGTAMSMTSTPAAPAMPSSRQFTISTVDLTGRPLEGAKIEFSVQGISYGSVVTGARGASIKVPWSVEEIEIEVSYGNKQQRATLFSGQPSHVLSFERSLAKTFAPASAKCPNGNAGQPCVDCIIDGKPIRICA